MSPKYKEPINVPVTENDMSLSFGILNLNRQVEEKYPTLYKTIVNICYEISAVGLPVREACLLWDMDFEKFTHLMEKDPLIKQLIEKKTLEYKRELLKILSASVKQGKSEKLAMDILMARFPDEFNRRKGSPSGEGDTNNNIIVNAIQLVRESGDSHSLINKDGGKIKMVESEEVVQEQKSRKSIMDKLSTLLG